MNIEEYFKEIEKKVLKAYSVAKKARAKGLDPEPDVEIPISKDLADRVENLISIINPIIKEINLSKKIREIEEQYGALEFPTILKVAEYAAKEIYNRTKDKKLAIELGLRAGFAYHTMGVVAAPTEGIVKVELKKRRDGKDYLAVYYAGPVRAAGGTPASFSVVVADYLRRLFDVDSWDPSEDEIQRYIIEIYDYNRLKRLQYLPSREELQILFSNLPIEVTGEPTEDAEVSAYKGLPRIETDRIRGGMALVIGEGLAQKAKKIWKKLSKIAEEFGLQDWAWLQEFLKVQEEIKAKADEKSEKNKEEKEEEEKIKPNWGYLSEITAGRPVFALPMAKGGFRLRYGKSRTNGHDACSIHPATATLTYEFLAWGTQIRTERPSKGAVITFSTTLEPPVVRLKNGKVMKVKSVKQAKKILKEVDKVLFLGDILITYGDFIDAGHSLVPVGYCEEWWIQEFEKSAEEKVKGFKVYFDAYKPRELFKVEGLEKLSEYLQIPKEKLEKFIRKPLKCKPNFREALTISLLLDVPLHPKYTFHWKDVSSKDVPKLYDALKKAKIVKEVLKVKDKEIQVAKRIEIELDNEVKKVLEEVLVEHEVENDKIVIKYPTSAALFIQLGCLEKEIEVSNAKTGLDVVQKISIVKIRDKVGTYIGVRMGRPEKAKIRELKGSPMMLFPVGEEGGRMRNLVESMNIGKVTAEVSLYYCERCKKEVIYKKCEFCGNEAIKIYYCPICKQRVKVKEHCGVPTKPFTQKTIDINKYISLALKNLNLSPSELPKVIKGPRGLSSKEKIPERLEKGILRAKYQVFVFRDGTIRFDAIEVPITYFKPKDLKYVTIEKLKEIGYTHDIFGNPLESEDQVLELKPQDVILPTIGPLKKGGKLRKDGFVQTLLNAAKFVDEELQRLYGLPPFYNAKTPEDLIGHLGIALAPHTSAGTVVRIIGFSETQTLLMHPLMHAAIRRNCDGDEGGFMLLMDALLNFSRHYLPKKRGGSMDAPLTITIKVDPKEVDDEVHNFDMAWNYPLELYESAEKCKSPEEVNVELLKHRLGKLEQYTNWGFMHDVTKVGEGNRSSAYKRLGAMLEKLNYQLKVAELCRASDKTKVAELVIDLHFARDVKGNLRKFSMQEFRCAKCNTKYRRVPLSGKCEKCGSRLVFTVSEGTVKKYLTPSLWLAEQLNFSPYMKSAIKVLELRVDQTFGKSSKEKKLDAWFNSS